ncbi:MAG: DUF1501 domain-containing protein [Ignavibacteriales bacterium]|nr:DUF1501 domain-containing protein [Ignavibacteriales bacterium]
MKRREFIHRTVPVALLPFMLNGLPLRAYGRAPLLDAMTKAAVATDRVLVLIQLGGGNDGINTVIARDQYDAYMNVRRNIAIPASSVLPLTETTGLHPVMTGMQSMYENGNLIIVQGVTYPNPDLSHFRATDIWLSAANYNENIPSGWLGRYLQQEFPGYPEGYPNEVMPDPLAIQIGADVSLSLKGSAGPMAVSFHDPNSFYQLIEKSNKGGEAEPPQTPAGRELLYIQRMAMQSQEYAEQVKAAADRTSGTARSTLYPASGQNYLADQLKIVATLIAGGLKTRLYIVNLYGFDTHSSQVDGGDTMLGDHAVLLQKLSGAISAFQDDLKILGQEDRVLGLTFSEFGRRVYSNSSLGTDHGTAAPMFLFGKGVRPGIVGTNPDLSDLTNGNLKLQFDFRSVYASVLHQWFGAGKAELDAALLRSYENIPIIRKSFHIDEQGNRIYPSDCRLYNNYPNPFNPSTKISYDLPDDGQVLVQIFDMAGRRVAVLVNGYQPAGHYEVVFTASARLASGAYVCELRWGDALAIRNKILLVR